MFSKSRRLPLLPAALAALLLCLAQKGMAQVEPVALFSPPNDAWGTAPYAINSSGQITGSYGGADYGYAFVRKADGDIVTLSVPQATSTGAIGTTPDGLIGGAYTDPSLYSYAFVWENGAFDYIDIPGAVMSFASSMNASGQLVGVYETQVFGAAYLRNRDGSIITFQACNGTNTEPGQINNSGEITGSYADSKNVYHGFIGNAYGACQSFDPPGSINTGPAAIDDNGDVAGSYIDSLGLHGFVRMRGQSIVAFDPPGSTGTIVTGINSKGYTVGWFEPGEGAASGFVRYPDGSFQVLPDTKLSAINKAGQVTGTVISNEAGIWVGELLQITSEPMHRK